MLLLALALAFGCTASAKSTPPEAVLKAFQQKFSGATDVEWEKESKTEWEAEFKLKGASMSANFANDGQWLETETEIALTELPAPVQAALKGKKVKETARIEKPGGVLQYEAEVKRKDWMFDASGKRLN